MVTVALSAALLTACSDDPETMLRSAKDYLAKNDPNAAAIQLKNALQKDGNLVEARFLLGRVNLEQGNIAGAVKDLRRAAERGYPDAQVGPLLARALLLSGEFDQVLKEFEGKTLDDRAGQAVLLGAVGGAHFAKGDLEKARAAYEAAAAADPSSGSARAGLAQVKLSAGELDGALADADAAIAADPGAADAHAVRADVLLMRKDIPGAAAALEEAIKARPKAVNYHFALVSMLLRENRVDKAMPHLEAMKKSAPQHPSTRYLQALVDLRNNRIEEARDNVTEAVRLAPGYLPARLLAGVIHIRLNQHVLAQEHLGVVLARAPKQPLARRMLAMSLMASGDQGRALTTLQPLLDASSVDSATMGLAGRIHVANGDLDRAAEYFAKVAAVEPENAMARTRLGVSKLLGGDTSEAFADLEAASDLESDTGHADVIMILAHLRRGELDKAMAAQRQLEAKQPNNPQTHVLKGGILLARKDAAGARLAFEKALELKPDSVAAAANLARMDIGEKRPDDARKRFEKIVAANPKNVEAHLLLADLLARTEAKPAEVVSMLERAAGANPAALAPKLALVRYYLGSKDPKKALLIAQEAAAGHADQPQAISMLARAQLAAGDQQQAVSSLNKLSELVSQSPPSLTEVADMQRFAKDRAGAERSLRRALEHKPDMFEAQQRLASLLAEDKRTDEALKISATVQKQRPKAAAGPLLEGQIHAASANWEPAVQAYRKALELEASAQTAAKLHAAQVLAGKAPDAAKTAADWLRTHPKDVVLRSYLAGRALAERRLDEAEKLFHKVDELSPDNAQVLNNLAWIAGQRKDPEALALAERALKLAPDNPAILDTLGMLQVERGQRDEGLENLRKAVGLSPGTGVLRLNLAKAYLKADRKDDARKELDNLLGQAPAGSPLHAEATKLKQGL
uniref:PEP-CTERM system TPR-repeat protein PrsT n=1 Tax=Aromatoleum anaerobium TaxID=182180 RepID=A0ABX1PM23_9RHOO